MSQERSVIWRGRVIRYAPFVFWVAVIFFLSSNAGSMQRTSIIIRPILLFVFPSASEQTLLIYHGYIRKFAHFAEYSMLAFLAFRAFSRSSLSMVRQNRFLLPVIVVLGIASLDEFNQSFEPSRTSSYLDILLDLSGGTFSILLLWLFHRFSLNASERASASQPGT